ncbi:MAG: 4-(cytidine 5'-diphospho)-2-C-methyl-D-erythritol kinase [Candidatus Aminicenantia bacterium]
MRSFAKINLGLEIEGLMPDGYHRIRTIFQSIDLFDVLHFERVEKGIELSGNRNDVPWNEENLIYKAAKKFFERFKISEGISIRVEKNVPPGSGLGGGSSNCACTLIALREIFKRDISKEEVVSLSSELGADVPYFFYGGTCIGEGKGDIIREIEDLRNYYFFLVIPEKIKVSTSLAYKEWDKSTLTFSRKNSKINKLEICRNFKNLKNDLEEVVFEKYEELKEIKRRIMEERFEIVMMSGSGSCIYGMTESLDRAEEIKEKFSDFRVEIVRAVGREEYWRRLFIN